MCYINSKTNPLLLIERNYSNHPDRPMVGKKSVALEIIKNIDHEERKRQNLSVYDVVNKESDKIIDNFSDEEKRQLAIIKLEHDMLLSQGQQALSETEIQSYQWLDLLQLRGPKMRSNYHRHIFLKQHKRNSAREKKIAKRIEFEERIAKSGGEKPQSSFKAHPHGRFFLRIFKGTRLTEQNHRVASSLMYGRPLVFDFDYVQHMRPQDVANTGRQMKQVVAINRELLEPFHLYFVNCPEDNEIYMSMKYQHSDLDTLNTAESFVTVTDKSYADLFPKRDLVYLTPQGETTLKGYNRSDIFIIGGFNDKANPKPISFARAKEENIRTARLPLDGFVGHREMTLDCMMKVMGTFEETRQWRQALEHIPLKKTVARKERTSYEPKIFGRNEITSFHPKRYDSSESSSFQERMNELNEREKRENSLKDHFKNFT